MFTAYQGYALDVRLYHNSSLKTRILLERDPAGTGGRYGTRSAGVALHLEVGDEVMLKAYSETNISGHISVENTFTGFLIHAS